MVKLALAIGFLAVFGFAAYSLVLLLTDYFKGKNNQDKEKTDQSNNQSSSN